MRLFREFRPVGNSRRLLVSNFTSVGTVNADQTFQYNVIPPVPVNADYATSWSLVHAVGLSYATQWSAKHAVGRDYYTDWYVGDQRLTNTRKLQPYRASGTLNRLLQTVGRVGSPGADHAFAWNIGGTVTRDFPLQWQVQSQGPGTGDPLGDPFVVAIGAIAASGTVAMDSPLSAINRDHLFVYNVNGAIGSMQPNSPTLAIGPIAAAGSVAMSSVQLTANADQSLQYSITNAAGLAYATRWTVNTSAFASHQIQWAIGAFSVVGADLTLQWSTISTTGRSYAIEYQVRIAVGRGYSFQYYVLEQGSVAFEFTPRWNVLQAVHEDHVFDWDSAGRQFADHSFLYRIGIRPAIDVIVRMPDDGPTVFVDVPEIALAYPLVTPVYATPIRL